MDAIWEGGIRSIFERRTYRLKRMKDLMTRNTIKYHKNILKT